LATPASLGLIALLFTEPRERIKALGIWGGIAGLAGTLGTVISGMLTDLASWRWIFFINLPVAAFALVMVPRLVSESRMVREHDKLDLAGPIAGTGGLVAIVYGLLQAASHPWGSVNVLLPLLGGVGLLVVMVAIEAKSSAPSIPLRFFRNRTRVVANFATLFLACAFFAYFFLLTLFEQQVLGYSPLRGGLSYLPMGIAMGAGIGLATKLIARLGVRPVLTAGLLLGAVGLLLTSGINVHSTYVGGVLPGMVLFGLASGLCFPCTANASLQGVTGQDSSLASVVQTTMQQVGGAVGLAFLVTLALRSAASHAHDLQPAVAATNGYVLAFRIGAVVLIVAGVMVAALLGHVSARQRGPQEAASAQS
jgi:MFS family permease